MEREVQRIGEKEAGISEDDEDKVEEARKKGLTVETEGMDVKVADILDSVLGMEVDGEGEEEEEGEVPLRKL